MAAKNAPQPRIFKIKRTGFPFRIILRKTFQSMKESRSEVEISRQLRSLVKCLCLFIRLGPEQPVFKSHGLPAA